MVKSSQTFNIDYQVHEDLIASCFFSHHCTLIYPFPYQIFYSPSIGLKNLGNLRQNVETRLRQRAQEFGFGVREP